MRVITTLELSVLANELKDFEGYYLEKFYEVAEDRFRIKLKNREKDANLLCVLSHTINRSGYIEKAEVPTNFTLAVRKRISGAKLITIEQLNNDRIIVFKLERGGETLNMIIEMFGRGNLIVTDAEMKILLAYKQHTFKDRSVNSKSVYKPPQNNLTEEKLTKQRSEMEAIQSRPAKVFVYLNGKDIIDYSFTDMEKYKGLEKKEFPKLQEALDFVYSNAPEAEEEESTEIKKLRASIEKQKGLLENFDEQIELEKAKGAKVFSMMGRINQVIAELQNNKRMSKEELQAMFADIKVISINLKEKTVTIEV